LKLVLGSADAGSNPAASTKSSLITVDRSSRSEKASLRWDYFWWGRYGIDGQPKASGESDDERRLQKQGSNK